MEHTYDWDRNNICLNPRQLKVNLPHDSTVAVLTAQKNDVWKCGFEINAFWFCDSKRPVGFDMREFSSEQAARYAAFGSAMNMMEHWIAYIEENEIWQFWDDHTVRRTMDELIQIMRDIKESCGRYASYLSEDSLFPGEIEKSRWQ